MIEEQLAKVITLNAGLNPLLVRTKLKEVLQDNLLEFVYNDPAYRGFLFTGGTCLHRLYGLPRLSEDLDFDTEETVDARAFAADAQSYIQRSLHYSPVQAKVSGNGISVTLMFPVLKHLGLVHSSADSPNLFLRCDLVRDRIGLYGDQRLPLSTGKTMFFVRAYDLPTLFGNKLAAFIGRAYRKGTAQTLPFKGRDVFDLMWFLQEAQRQNWALMPNWPRVLALLNARAPDEVLRDASSKAAALNPTEVMADLRPFIEDQRTLEAFTLHLPEVLPAQLTALAHHLP
ncbi:MAG: nucleotidyl transferase AbiEii/AbiGii toxin family protein [Candidatus Cryosericum sp.]